MAKKVVAVTNISFGTVDGESVKFLAGEEVDVQKYGVTKEQLEQLYDSGAITVEEIPDAPAKTVPAKATTSEVKSSAKSDTA